MRKGLFESANHSVYKSSYTVKERIVETAGSFFEKIAESLRIKKAAAMKMEMSLNMAEEVANIASWDYDTDQDCVYVSDALYSMFGMKENAGNPKKRATYQTMLGMVLEEDRQVVDNHLQHVKMTGNSMKRIFRVRMPDQSIITVQLKAEAFKNSSGIVTRIFGIVRDISEELRIETKLKESEEKLEKVSASLDVGIWSYDLELDKMVYVSNGIERLTGEKKEHLLLGLRKWQDYVCQEDMEKYLENYSQLRIGKATIQQYRIKDAGGHVKWIECKGFPIFNQKGELYRLDGTVQDISERRLLEEKMHYYAYHDILTDLPNRSQLVDVLNELISRKSQFALMYIDLDMFKNVNDRLGSQIGDKLLQKLAQRLKFHSKNTGQLYRISGDKFALILPGLTEPSRLASIGRTMIESMEQLFDIDGYEIHISGSIGISIYPKDGLTIKELELNTEIALRRSKELGKSMVQFYTKGLSVETLKLFSMENDLRKAISSEELVLHYQPKFNTATGNVVGAEALIRWNHPALGLLPPVEFIPIAEESSLIDEISYWVIREVCKLQRKLIEYSNVLVPISVNLSAKTLMRADLIPTILKYLDDYKIEPHLLEIEITENTMIKMETAVLSAIDMLKKLGLSISLDDFGTGYSSISYLKKFKVNFIKIDRSFIASMLDNPEDAGIVESIHRLARGFNLKVVAEGVETVEQLKELKQLNCHFVQGYLFSKPIEEAQFIRFITKDPIVLPT